MQVFETSDDLLNYSKKRDGGHFWVCLHKLLHRDWNPWVQFSSLVEKVHKVLVKLSDSLAKVENVISTNSRLVFIQFHHFINHLRYFVLFISLEDDVASQYVLKAHSIR